jgi:hypothetical protein
MVRARRAAASIDIIGTGQQVAAELGRGTADP